jgi:hypothetical protein
MPDYLVANYPLDISIYNEGLADFVRLADWRNPYEQNSSEFHSYNVGWSDGSYAAMKHLSEEHQS